MIAFTDCSRCGKRVRSDADRCHHCGFEHGAAPSNDESGAPEFAEGGYSSEADDFHYEDFIREEFGSEPAPRRRVWYYVAWLMVIVLLLPSLLQILQLLADP